MSIPALAFAAVLLTIATPLWMPIALLVDGVRLRRRFPIARLLTFGVAWCWIELAGVAQAFGLWLTRRADDHAAQYRLMAWWSNALMGALRLTLGIRPEVVGGDAAASGNVVILSRHASLADSLLSGWALSAELGVWPRYVLKKELLFDPCLDIVGRRVPNHFLDRDATDSDAELNALRRLASGIGPGIVGVIFAEGTRSNERKRVRALEKIAERDPARALRLAGLKHLLPPRPAGSAAMIDGAAGADVVVAWHTGFDGMDSFGGMIAKLAHPLPPVRFVMRRVARSEVPDGDAFLEWLDDQWLQMDAEVAAALAS